MMRRSADILAGSAVWVLLVCAAHGWAADPNVPGQPADLAPELQKLMIDRPAVPVTAPENVDKPEETVAPPADTTLVIDRLCTLRPDPNSHWVVIEFPDEPGRRHEPPRWALPCERLERMEAVLATHPDTLFRVSGESTLYKERPFLLITKEPVIVMPEEPPASRAREEHAPPAHDADDSRPPDGDAEPASQPDDGANATSRPAGEEPSAEDVFSELMRDKPGKVLDPTEFTPQPERVAPSVAPKLPAPEIDRQGFVVNRITRVLPEDPQGWRLAVFKSDNTLQEPPLRLLPCRWLEVAENHGRVPLMISGLVTHYKGRSYLLIRKVIPFRDMGQF